MTENTNDQKTTLVLGGTGKTGRRVAARLATEGVPIRIGSRSGRPAFDWDDESTWAPVLEGVASVYVTYYPDLAFPGAVEKVGSFSRLAVALGVRRLVLLSGRGEEGALAGEQAVRESGAEWTIVRASWFCQNFSEHFLLDSVRAGVIALPAGDIVEPFIDVDDIADVVVAALTCDGHAGQVYEVTGPELLTFADAAAEIAVATGREIRYVGVTPDEFSAGLIGDGVPADFVADLTALFVDVLDGHNAYVTDGVWRALGRAPRSFAAYARAAAATGVWTVDGPPEREPGRMMIEGPAFALVVVCALGCGLVGGVFLAFSAFVMKALSHLPPAEGMAAMQWINAAAPSPLFMCVLFGTAVASVAVIVSSVVRLDEPASVWLVVGGALYLAVIGLTIGYHVPRNTALAKIDPRSVEAARVWAEYMAGWTAWNHVRTLSSLAAAATLTVGLRAG